MIEYVKSIFSENSLVSHMRWLAQQAFIVSAYLAIYGAHSGKDTSVMACAFLTAAIGGKLGQKIVESKKEGA